MENETELIGFIRKSCPEPADHIRNLIALLDGGATIPFIARYRKERTGNMDEVTIDGISRCYRQYQELVRRREAVSAAITAQGRMTPGLQDRIAGCMDLRTLEDLYLPYRSRRQTRASRAKDRGLEPLAGWLMKQEAGDPGQKAARYVRGEVKDVEEALQGARDIMAEWMNERIPARNRLRALVSRSASVCARVVKGREDEGAKYSDYFDYSEKLCRCPSHRMLAVRRGEAEGVLRVGLEVDSEEAFRILSPLFVKNGSPAARQVETALKDAYRRLLFPSVENESLALAKSRADDEAIRIFADNLRQLLMAAPLGNRRVMGIDPGFRTGCKVVCLDATGGLVHNETVFLHTAASGDGRPAHRLVELAERYRIEAVAIGNGTGGRETERLVRGLEFRYPPQIFVVSENGASVYSASKTAREEFPDKDITVRGAVSIARRLMDPLAELVKIDPKAIGVGQYQHDVDQVKLKEALDRTVESCVNEVGVNVNTAGRHLLARISGLGPALAENIEAYIRENGPFRSRQELKRVKRMGAKAFEQCAGFLRIGDADNPLDNSSVHPESYHVVERMAADLGVPVSALIGNVGLCAQIRPEDYTDADTGLPTVKDIVSSLKKLGRDVRSFAKIFKFAESIENILDLEEGMVLPGIVTNLTAFGAFVDIGVHQDGLVHISEMSERYITDPSEILHLHEHVKVRVKSVDRARGRIYLSLKM